jgi:hypothetical protein
MSTVMTTEDDQPNNRKRESRPEVITISGKQYVAMTFKRAVKALQRERWTSATPKVVHVLFLLV